MTSDEVKNLLIPAFADATIDVDGEGAKFDISIVSEIFAGKRAVPRQQMVYAVLNDQISSGDVHAVTMTLKTPDEVA